MSAEYRPIKNILFNELFNNRLEKYGIGVEMRGEHAALIGPNGVLFAKPEGKSIHLERQLGVDTIAILEALSQEFDTEIVDENDHRFWGFSSLAEMFESFRAVEAERAHSANLHESDWIVVEGPSPWDAEFAVNWLQFAIEADRLLQCYFDENPGFRRSIRRLELMGNVEFATAAMAFLGMWLKDTQTFMLHLVDSEWGDVISIMATIGFFMQTGDRYQMTIPMNLKVEKIKDQLIKLAATEDAEYIIHPEQLVVCMRQAEAIEWKRNLDGINWQQRLADREALLAE
jgi:hypothetical protein